MISNSNKWHFLAIKDIPMLFRGIISKHNGDFYCLEMPDKDNNILKYDPGEKSMKIPDAIYLDFECLLENISTCSNDPEKSSTTNICKHTYCGFSLFSYCSFDKCNMNYKITKNIPIISHNLSSYDCHLIIKKIAKEFDGELECLGENTENILVFL